MTEPVQLKELLETRIAEAKHESGSAIKSLAEAFKEMGAGHIREHRLHDEAHKRQHDDSIIADEKAAKEVARRFELVNDFNGRTAILTATFATREYVDGKLDGQALRLEQTAVNLTKERETTAKALGEQVISSAKALSDQVSASALVLSDQVKSAAKEVDGRMVKIEDRVRVIEDRGSASTGKGQGASSTISYIVLAISVVAMLISILGPSMGLGR